jgi:hypothetical protein
VFIPFLQKKRSMLDDQGANLGQFMAAESFGHGDVDGVQPVFGDLFTMFDMHGGSVPSPLKKKNRYPRTIKMGGMAVVYQ